MKIIYNDWIPFRGFRAINLFGVLFVRRSAGPLTPSNLQHEAIHTAQMQELFYVPFYLIYFVEWIIRLSVAFIHRRPCCVDRVEEGEGIEGVLALRVNTICIFINYSASPGGIFCAFMKKSWQNACIISKRLLYLYCQTNQISYEETKQGAKRTGG